MKTYGNQWKSYNNEPVGEGQVLVPQLVSLEYARSIGTDMRNVRTWTKGGVSYPVIFVPVPEEMEAFGWQVFQADENDYLDEQLGPNRYARCLVPREDGGCRVCPKECGGVRNLCTACPHRGEYAREDRSLFSLDILEGDDLFTQTESSAESVAMEEILLAEMISELARKNPLFEQVIRLGYQGMNRKEVAQELPLAKSRAYELYRQCREEAERFLQG